MVGKDTPVADQCILSKLGYSTLENVKRQRDRRAAVARQCRHAQFDTDSNAIGHNYNRTRSVPEIQAEKYASLSRLAENTVLSSCKVSLQC